MAKVEAVIAMGSNLGDRGEHIKAAFEQLGAVAGITPIALSPIVESYALTESGYDETKPRYLNAVAIVKTSLKPKPLLSALQAIESEHGRVRIERWGSRTLDLDIVTYGSELKASKELTIPHPRAYQRPFVLMPWLALDPNAVLPGHGPVAQIDAASSTEVWFL